MLAEGVRLVGGEFLAEGFFDGVHDGADVFGGGAPGIDAEAGFFLEERVEALEVGGIGVHIDEALKADVFVGPDAPTGVVFAEDVELIDEDVVAHVVFFGDAEVDGAELADPDGRVGLAHVGGALEEGFFEVVFVDEDVAGDAGVITPFVKAGEGVVVAGIDSVGPYFLEDVEFGGVFIAIEKEKVVGIDGTDGIVEAFVKGIDHGAGGVGGFIDGVVAGDPGIVAVAGSKGFPEVNHAVLKMFVIPEEGAVRGVVGVPMLVLKTRQGMQIDDGVDVVLGAAFNCAVEDPETVLDEFEGLHV